MLKKIDKSIVILILLFAIISVVTIYSATTYLSIKDLAIKQVMWYLIGFILVFVILKFNNKIIYKHAWFLYIVGNILLLLLLIIGTPINNSKCWFIIPGVGSFQPSEFMKIFLIMVLGITIYKYKPIKKHPLKSEVLLITKCLFITLIPSILTFLEPDTGVVIIYFLIMFVMLFFSGIRLRWFILGLLIIISLFIGILLIYFLYENLFIDLFGNDIYYRINRLLDWQQGVGMQLENSVVAIGSASLLGHGYNNTPLYFPESGTDFIFSVFASNFGFVITTLLLGIIFVFDYKLIKLSSNSRKIDKYVLIGIITMLVFQQIQNIGMTIGLLPIMGITLPFISYGGSSLISYMFIVGIILNISKKK